jgi:hypothetical protein
MDGSAGGIDRRRTAARLVPPDELDCVEIVDISI